jgi:hypothetical protein
MGCRYKPITRSAAYKPGVGDPRRRLAGYGQVRMVIGGDLVEAVRRLPGRSQSAPAEPRESYVYQGATEEAPECDLTR